MTLTDNGNYADGSFSFEIQTNFGDLEQRQSYDSQHSHLRWIDSYTTSSPYLRMQNFAAGDLYIRVHDGAAESDRVYGLVMESRNGDDTDPWYRSLSNAGYTSYAQKTQGELYQLMDGDAGFATGTFEDYADEFDEVPLMNNADGLPGLADDTANNYPTIMLDGSLVAYAQDNVRWMETTGTDYTGVWQGSFQLPEFDAANEYLEVWWAMECGNDAVSVIASNAGSTVPTPSSLLLLGIGTICSAGFLRKKKK
jgi:hypothetical protein